MSSAVRRGCIPVDLETTSAKAYIEVMSFDGLVNAATERNRAFFDKLGLPT